VRALQAESGSPAPLARPLAAHSTQGLAGGTSLAVPAFLFGGIDAAAGDLTAAIWIAQARRAAHPC